MRRENRCDGSARVPASYDGSPRAWCRWCQRSDIRVTRAGRFYIHSKRRR